MKYNLTEIQELIKDRRTIFPEHYKTRKVHREQVEKMLEAANWAPNHGQTEPWRFKVFSGEPLEQWMHFLAETYRQLTPADKFMEGKYTRYMTRAKLTSFAIAICMKRQTMEKIPEMEEIMAVACAVQNMMLVGTAYGIGTFWSSGHVLYSDEVKDYLQLSAKDRCLGLLYVGYPEGEWPKGKRNTWLNKVEWFTGEESLG